MSNELTEAAAILFARAADLEDNRNLIVDSMEVRGVSEEVWDRSPKGPLLDRGGT